MTKGPSDQEVGTIPLANDSNSSDTGRNPAQADTSEASSSGTTIVGVGASAGGLEAFEEFFSAVPPKPGCAFVAIMHLDPHHKSMLPELLGKVTDLEVVAVTEGMDVEANRIHVIPPNTTMFLEGRTLTLEEPSPDRGRRHPIDDFLRSLAREQGERAVGIIFSGTGSDGVQGLREIKFAGGISMIQDPSTAKYDAMPSGALRAGVVDVSLPPSKLAKRLVDILTRRGEYNIQTVEKSPEMRDDLQLLLDEVNGRTGRDLSCYKRSTLSRRIQKRMLLREQPSLSGYRNLLRTDRDEVDNLLKELLIGVTSFFRDEEVFERVEKEVLPQLLASKDVNEPIRIWIPGCASGEEAYSLAITIAAYMDDHEIRRKVQIFATDLDEDAINVARGGRYASAAIEDVPIRYRERFFRNSQGCRVVAGRIREMVVFAPHDLISNPPFFKLDLISCRNLLIYFTNEIQKKIIPMFFHSLNADGYLILGPSETLGSHSELFSAVDAKWKIFRRNDVPASHVDIPITTKAPWKAEKDSEPTIQRSSNIFAETLFEEMLKIFGLCGVLLNRNDEVLQVLGDVHNYLGLPAGSPTNNVFKMARGSVLVHLRTAVHKCRKTGEPAIIRDIRRADDSLEPYDIHVQPLSPQKADRGRMLVAFIGHGKMQSGEGSIPAEVARDQLVQQLQEELRLTNERLQAMSESSDTANEELKSSNEELMSMNEELQSTNEELETSQEELQALNEELTTVNSELQSKITELDTAKDDLENLLRSTDIATIFIDRDFVIRQFTPAASEIFSLVDGDVGRPLRHFANRVPGHDVIEDAKTVLKNSEKLEKELQSTSGDWYLLRAFPYRTLDEDVEGVVLTYVEISERKNLEEELKKALEQKGERLAFQEHKLNTVFERSPAFICVTRAADGEYVEVNPAYCTLTGYTREELIGKTSTALSILDKGSRDWVIKMVDEGGAYQNVEFTFTTKTGEKRLTLASGELVNFGGESLVLSVGMDITVRRKALKELEQAKCRAEEASAAKGRFLANMSHEIRTPLTGMLGMVGMLARSEMSAENRKYFDGLQKAGESLKAIIDDILDLSKIEANKMEIVKAPFELRPSLNSVGTLFESMARDKGLRLDTNYSARVPDCIETDEGKLQQVVRNLLSNAIKFTHEGGVAMDVDYLPTSGNPELILTVSDTGIGIPRDKIDALFQDFEQLDAGYVKEFGGTGLGLSICKRLLTMLGGAISVQSEHGNGAVFTVVLPAPTAPCAPNVKKEKYPEDFCSGMKILVAEDNEVIKLIMGEMLSSFKCHHRIVSNGREALDALDTGENFDLILMDVNMPILDGLSATEQIRKSEKRYKDIPIVALTAYAMKEDVENILARGMNAHLPKPITMESLFEMLAGFRSGPPAPEKSSGEIVRAPVRRAVLLDAESLDKSLGNNLPLLDELASTFAKEGRQRLEQLRKHLENDERPQAAGLAHAMGGSAAILGLNMLSAQSLELEQALMTAGMDYAGRLDEVETLFEDSMAALQLWREDRKG